VDLVPGSAKAFEAAIAAGRSGLQGETLWFRMVAGRPTPRYVRLHPEPSLSALLAGASEQELPDAVRRLITKATAEIWTLRPPRHRWSTILSPGSINGHRSAAANNTVASAIK
jgi:hypothetical protein